MAKYWPAMEEAARRAKAHTLVGPSVNFAGGEFGKPEKWYEEFFKACDGCRIDAIAISVFSCNLDGMKRRIRDLRKFQKDIYVTAFACGDNPEIIEAFDGRMNKKRQKTTEWQCQYMKDVVPYLDREPLVAGYAWYSVGEPGKPNQWVGESALVNKAGQITELGKCYFGIMQSAPGKRSRARGQEMDDFFAGHDRGAPRREPIEGFNPKKAGACNEGDRVQCTDPLTGRKTNDFCQGDSSCCPDGTACPSASREYEGTCKRKYDCTSWVWSKLGISHNQVSSKAFLRGIRHSNISWVNDWTPNGESRISNIDLAQTDVTYLPMAWGKKDRFLSLEDSSILLGFNEPNDPNQANIDPWTAAALWKDLEKHAAKHGVHTLVGPSVNYAAGKWNDPVVWYDEFLKACVGCRIDAIGMHVYTCTLAQMKDRVNAYRKYKKPIWITEFACADNPWQIKGNRDASKDWHWHCKYMREVVPWLNGQDIVAGYAWFSHGDDPYVGDADLVMYGSLTPLGQCYSELAGEIDEDKAVPCSNMNDPKNAKCKNVVEWTYNQGRKNSQAPQWYKWLPQYTGVDYTKATLEDFQRGWFCNPWEEKGCGTPPCTCSKPPCSRCFHLET